VRKHYQTNTTAKPINIAATTPMKAGKPTDGREPAALEGLGEEVELPVTEDPEDDEVVDECEADEADDRLAEETLARDWAAK